MNSPIQRAGLSPHTTTEQRHKERAWFIFVIAGVTLLIMLVALSSQVLGIGGAGFVALVIIARLIMDVADARAVRAPRTARTRRPAIQGETPVEVASFDLTDPTGPAGLADLTGLGADFLVLHGIPSPYGQIDHVVIGRHSGVIATWVKALPGRISVANGRVLANGHETETDFVALALRSSYWLRDRIRSVLDVDVWVTPIVVYPNAVVECTLPVKGVVNISSRYLPAVLHRPNHRASNQSLWAGRHEIMKELYQDDIAVESYAQAANA